MIFLNKTVYSGIMWAYHEFYICLIYPWETVDKFRKLHPAESSHMETQISNICRLPQLTKYMVSHTHPYLVLQLSSRFQRTLLLSLHNNSQAVLHFYTTWTRKIQIFFLESIIIILSFYIFLKHCSHIKLRHQNFLLGA